MSYAEFLISKLISEYASVSIGAELLVQSERDQKKKL